MADHPTADWPQDYARILLPEIDSTNAEALRRLPGLSGPAWIMALRQTAGRGRRGAGAVLQPPPHGVGNSVDVRQKRLGDDRDAHVDSMSASPGS